MGKASIDYTNTTCIIVLNINDTNLGIIVDSVQQVIDIDKAQISPVPTESHQELINGMISLNDTSFSFLIRNNLQNLYFKIPYRKKGVQFMLTINEADFQRLVRFVKQHYGIDLSKKNNSSWDGCPTRSWPWDFRPSRLTWII